MRQKRYVLYISNSATFLCILYSNPDRIWIVSLAAGDCPLKFAFYLGAHFQGWLTFGRSLLSRLRNIVTFQKVGSQSLEISNRGWFGCFSTSITGGSRMPCLMPFKLTTWAFKTWLEWHQFPDLHTLHMFSFLLCTCIEGVAIGGSGYSLKPMMCILHMYFTFRTKYNGVFYHLQGSSWSQQFLQTLRTTCSLQRKNLLDPSWSSQNLPTGKPDSIW